MKIVIDINEAQDFSLSPSGVYRALRREYVEKLRKQTNDNLWGMENACDNAARELYAKIINRPSNVKNLILTYSDAEKCAELFIEFADVWVSKIE